MEVVGHERGGGQGGEGGCEQERERPVDEMGSEGPALRPLASLRHERIGIEVVGRDPGLHHRDQRGDGGE